jgi:chromosome segregation ATPase
MLKKTLLLYCFLQLLVVSLYGQEVRRQQQTLQGQQYSGYSIKVPYAEHQAKRYWLSYLKERGKVTERRQFIELKDIYWLNARQDAQQGQQAYSLVTGDSTKSEIWIGYASTKEDATLDEAIKEQLEKAPFLMKKYQLMASLQDAEAALSFMNREVESLRRNGNKLEGALKKNASEKERLEQQLVKNGEDKVRLEGETEANKKKLEQQQLEAEKISKQLQALKDKLSQLQE